MAIGDIYGQKETASGFEEVNLNEEFQNISTGYNYYAASPTEDTVGDWRQYGDNNGFYIQYCTVGNAVKGAGTWVSKFTTQV
jgi:hypothetical protein